MFEPEFMRPSNIPYGGPMWFVPKKVGSLQFCIDSHLLNKRTVWNKYFFPLPEGILDRLGGARVFSKIDFKSCYWRMIVHEKGIPRTVLRTCWHLYEVLAMTFGVTNGPSQFMNMVNDVFSISFMTSSYHFWTQSWCIPTLWSSISNIQGRC